MKTEKYPKHPLQVRLDARPLPRLQAAIDRLRDRRDAELKAAYSGLTFARSPDAEPATLFCHLTGVWPECTKYIRDAIAERKLA